ncbi:MAG TPA: hypothetical protein QGF86_00810 [Nitrospinaceae bacterium]|nr:hypothetical protein [Nitrospinaceae bacterium]
MKLINPFLIVIQFLFIILVLRNDAIAGEPSCIALLHPLESKVDEIKGHGGIWGMFEKNYKVRAHARVTLKLDSKIMVLLVRLNHLCSTQNGVPFDEIAQVLVPQLKEKGEQVLIEELVNIGHTLKKAKILIAYAKFAQNNLNRKLDFNRISQAVKESQPYVDRLVGVSKKIGEVESDAILADAKTLISDIEKFLATDPYLILAEKESAEVPHARYITGDSDAM